MFSESQVLKEVTINVAEGNRQMRFTVFREYHSNNILPINYVNTTFFFNCINENEFRFKLTQNSCICLWQALNFIKVQRNFKDKEFILVII